MISKEEVKHIAKLARLGLDDKELGKFQKELSSILDYFAKLKEVDVSKVRPTCHSQPLENIMREDRPKAKDPKLAAKLIKQAPESKDGFWKVKSVF